jgi:hypothetical protein
VCLLCGTDWVFKYNWGCGFRLLVAGLQPQRPRFDPSPILGDLWWTKWHWYTEEVLKNAYTFWVLYFQLSQEQVTFNCRVQATQRFTRTVLATYHVVTRIFWRVRKISKSSYLLRHVCPSVLLSVCDNSNPTGRIFMKYDTGGCFENLSRKFKCHQNRTRIRVTLHGDHYTCFIISLSFLFRMKNVSDKSCRGNQNTHFVFNTFHPPPPPKIVPFMR